MKNQAEYYKKRAKEYERLYEKAERQEDLRKIEQYLETQFLNKKIIDLGCGTGFWTEKIAKNCRSILAIDINEEVINIAQEKQYENNNVTFEVMDLNQLPNRASKLEGLFGGFIWSHIKKEDIPEFLNICYSQLQPDSDIIFIDNKYIEGSSTAINRIDKNGNQYQLRKLSSGEVYEVVKNFPTQLEFSAMIHTKIGEFEWIEFDYYWIAKFRKRSNRLHGRHRITFGGN